MLHQFGMAMKQLTDYHITAISYFIISVALACIIPLHLLASFFAGFLIYETILSLDKVINRYTQNRRTKLIISIALSVAILSTLAFAMSSLISFALYDLQGHGMATFNQHIDHTLMSVQQEISHYLPSYIPANVADLKNSLLELIKNNLELLKTAGTDLIHNIATTLIGLIIGILVSIQQPRSPNKQAYPVFKQALIDRVQRLADSFRNVVFAQIKISLINTGLFIIFCFVILPLFGVSLPFAKTLTIITFIFGLIPIVGNLLSNSLIVVSGLTISLPVALSCLLYLVLIHKLEYFINAQIIGTKINAKAWEVLLAMLIFESIFGLSGLIVAPIFYAYLKLELSCAKMI